MNHKQFDKHLVSLIAPASFAAEQYQALRLKIERVRQSRDLRVIAITSPGAADGKTVTSINLAAALGRGSHARVLIIDTPPLVPVVDSALLARLVDGVLLVVAANRTPRKLLEEALNQLDAAKVLGIVFNSDSKPLYGYYDSGYRRYFSRNRQASASL